MTTEEAIDGTYVQVPAKRYARLRQELAMLREEDTHRLLEMTRGDLIREENNTDLYRRLFRKAKRDIAVLTAKLEDASEQYRILSRQLMEIHGDKPAWQVTSEKLQADFPEYEVHGRVS